MRYLIFLILVSANVLADSSIRTSEAVVSSNDILEHDVYIKTELSHMDGNKLEPVAFFYGAGTKEVKVSPGKHDIFIGCSFDIEKGKRIAGTSYLAVDIKANQKYELFSLVVSRKSKTSCVPGIREI